MGNDKESRRAGHSRAKRKRKGADKEVHPQQTILQAEEGIVVQRRMIFPEEFENHIRLIDLQKAILYDNKLPEWFRKACKKRKEGLELDKLLVVQNKIDKWINLRTSKNGHPPQIQFEGELLEWVDPAVYVSGIPGLGYCTYQHGLTAKMYQETGELPEPSEEATRLMEGGQEGHAIAGRLLDVPPEIDFTQDIVKDSPWYALSKLLTLEDATTIEFPIAQPFKDIYIRGRIDHVTFSNGSPKLVEEWKFTKNGKVKPAHILQAKIYSYLMYKWLDSLDFEHAVKVWPWSTWGREDEEDSLDSEIKGVEPSDVVTGKFTEATIREVEYVLNRANLFYTGKQECQADPGPGCDWCPHKNKCKHYEKTPWVEGSVLFTEKDTIISFKVS